MALFQNNTNSDLLIAIEYTKILFRCSYAIESIIFELSKKDFGSVTAASKNILKNTRSGQSVYDALTFEKNVWQNKNMQSFISSLSSSSSMDISRRLTDLSKHILSEKKLNVENFIDTIRSNLNRIIIVLTVPLFTYFLLNLVKDSLSYISGSITSSKISIITNIALIISAAATIILLSIMRYKE